MRKPSPKRSFVVVLEAFGGLLRRVLPLSAPRRLLQVPLAVCDLAGVPGERWGEGSVAIAWRDALAGFIATDTDLLQRAQIRRGEQHGGPGGIREWHALYREL